MEREKEREKERERERREKEREGERKREREERERREREGASKGANCNANHFWPVLLSQCGCESDPACSLGLFVSCLERDRESAKAQLHYNQLGSGWPLTTEVTSAIWTRLE